jgi:catechol 2,3-dioxygenase-like lactoylglutathione lyase family enzyme
MLKIHHVNIGIPEDGLETETAFLVDVIGLRHLQPGLDSPATANWFEADGGVQIHVSKDPKHRAPERAHVAFEIGNGIPELERILVERAVSYRSSEDDAGRRLFFADPAGNLFEIRGTV